MAIQYQPWEPKPYLDRAANNVRGYLRLLHYLGQVIQDQDRGSPQDGVGIFRPHNVTYLKLLVAMAYARNCFLKVGSQLGVPLRYLDVLSAGGLSLTQENSRPVPASAIAVPMAMHDFGALSKAPPASFTEAWAFEADATALGTLDARIGRLRARGVVLPNYHFQLGDANAGVATVMKTLAAQDSTLPLLNRPLTLAFIDNIGLNIAMQTIRTIQTSVRADLIIHIPVQAVFREVERTRKQGGGHQKIDDFFGNDSWKRIQAMEDVAPIYHECVQAHTDGEFQDFEPVPIQGGNASFAMAIYTRKRRGATSAQQWIGMITALADACRSLNHQTIDDVFAHAALGRKNLWDYADEPAKPG